MQAGLLTCLALLASVSADTGASTGYVRPSKSAELDLSHPQLSRAAHSSPHQPSQIHLALALSPGAVAITWVTHPQEDLELAKRKHKKKHEDPACEHLRGFDVSSVVQWSTQPGNLEQTVSGNHTCYVADEYESGAIHRVLLGLDSGAPLPPSSTIFYRVGDPELAWSAELNFTTQPAMGVEALPYRLGLMGDVGQTADSAATMQHLLASAPQSVLDVGDISYADGFQPRWDSYGRLAELLTSVVPTMHIEGNHEVEVTNGHLGFLAYESRFYAPSAQSGSGTSLYYSYEVAGAHIVMLGSYAPYGKHSAQRAWLQADLATVDRARTPWLLVGMHAPWYNSNTAHQGEVDDMRESLEDLLFAFGVDIVFAGHVHAYERAARVRGMQRDPCGPLHICIGDGGNREGLSLDYLPRPDWSDFREPSFGSGVLLMQNATHVHWQWHRNQDKQPVVSDATWVVRTSAEQCQGSRASILAGLQGVLPAEGAYGGSQLAQQLQQPHRADQGALRADA